MANTEGTPAPFPPGFVDQVMQFFREQQADGVEQLVCYDRDENVELIIRLPATDPAHAAAQYAQAWRSWRNGGSVIRLRANPPAGMPQNEYRQPLSDLPDFGLAS